MLSPNTLKMQEKSCPCVHFSTTHAGTHIHPGNRLAGNSELYYIYIEVKERGGVCQGAAWIPRPDRPNSWPPECGSYLRSVCHNWNSGFLKWARPVALMGGAAAEGEQQEWWKLLCVIVCTLCYMTSDNKPGGNSASPPRGFVLLCFYYSPSCPAFWRSRLHF